MNFQRAVAEPLQPDVFVALSPDPKSSPESVDEEIEPFANMLRASTMGYIGWRRMALPDDELHRYMSTRSEKGIRHDSEMWDLCTDKRNYIQLQWRTLYHALDMIKDHEKDVGSKYKAVVRARTDVVLERIFPPPEVLFKALDKAQLLVPWAYEKKASNGRRLLDDQFAVMTRDMASIYFNTFDLFDCGKKNKDLSNEREWCNVKGWNKDTSECYLGQQVYKSKGSSCIMTFEGLFGQDMKWKKHMVTECGKNLYVGWSKSARPASACPLATHSPLSMCAFHNAGASSCARVTNTSARCRSKTGRPGSQSRPRR